MSTLETNLIQPSTGTTLQVGASGDTITVPSGATFNVAGTLQSGGSTLVTGKILQAVTAVDTTYRTSTSTSWVTASNTATVSITPSSTSSRIWVVCTCNMNCNDGDDAWVSTIYRGVTNIGNATHGLASGNSVPGVSGNHFPTTMTVLDSPSTTSATTYQLYIKLLDLDADGASINIGGTAAGSATPVPSHMTAFEVGP